MEENISKTAWRWVAAFAGLIAALLAGSFSDDVAPVMVVAAGILLGASALIAFDRGPGILKGCLIAIGGVLLGFFSCLGVFTVGLSSGTGVGFLAAVAIAGFVVALGGSVVALVRFIKRRNEE
jgi:hypothetical protein